MANLEHHTSDRDRICKLCGRLIARGETAVCMKRVRVSPKVVDLHFHSKCLDREYASLKGQQ